MYATDEIKIGILTFVTSTKGIGGKLKVYPEDFRVEEIPIPIGKVDTGKFVIAKIRTRNWETNKLIHTLSRKLKISRSRIGFAGAKDKRSVTIRTMSFHTNIENVKNISLKDVEILEIYRSNRCIELGDLLQNRFDIKIRNLNVQEKESTQIIEKVKEEILSIGGFPNFFGVQRFGATRPITHICGKYLIQSKFKECVETYLGNPTEHESQETFKARKFFDETKNYKEALKFYPKSLIFERAMLHSLSVSEDYVKALEILPKNLLMMFIHSYQSYLFNLILSERLKRGLPLNMPIVGDIVLPVDKYGLPDTKRYIKVTDQNIEKLSALVKKNNCFVSGILFGSKSPFAEGEQGDCEKKVIENEKISAEDFVVPEIPYISSKGRRRELLAPLKDITINVTSEYVQLKFTLNRGCYATSLLREFMKTRMRNY